MSAAERCRARGTIRRLKAAAAPLPFPFPGQTVELVLLAPDLMQLVCQRFLVDWPAALPDDDPRTPPRHILAAHFIGRQIGHLDRLDRCGGSGSLAALAPAATFGGETGGTAAHAASAKHAAAIEVGLYIAPLLATVGSEYQASEYCHAAAPAANGAVREERGVRLGAEAAAFLP